MSDLALSLIRAGVQTVWGFLAALAIAHGVGLSRTAPEWAVQGVTALVMLAAVAVLRLVERRWPGVGRWLMLGIQALPRYIRPGASTGGRVTSFPTFLDDTSRTCTVPAASPSTVERMRKLVSESTTGGTTTASGAATVKLDPPQPPTGGTPGDGKDAA